MTRSLATALTAVAFASAGAGCGGNGSGQATNEVAKQTGQEAYEASRAAVREAESVRVRGTSSTGRLLKSSVDLKLTREGGGGTVNLLGTDLGLVRSGDALYVKGSPALYRRLGIKRKIPPHTWADINGVGQLKSITDLAEETARVMSSAGLVTKGATTTLDGEPVLELKTKGKLYTGRLFVKTTGNPYPIKLEKRGQEKATFSFTGWNATAAPSAPAKSVQIQG